MHVLCKCKNKNDTKELEDSLLKRFFGKKQCLNSSQHGEGGIEEGVNYVYIAFYK